MRRPSSRESLGLASVPARCGGDVVRPDRLAPDERLSEIAEILAAGLQRLLARQSSQKSADCGESSLDFRGERSGHPEGLASERDR